MSTLQRQRSQLELVQRRWMFCPAANPGPMPSFRIRSKMELKLKDMSGARVMISMNER